MIRYLTRRLAHGVLLLAGVSVLLFAMQEAAPGDFFLGMRLNPEISEQTLQGLRTQYGLDRSLPQRYVLWIRSAVRGDLGPSFAYDLPVTQLLWPRIRNTLLLSVPALVIAWLIAIPLGLLAAWRRSGWVDHIFSGSTSTLLAVPDVLLALLAVMFALRTHFFPAGGMAFGTDGGQSVTGLLRHMALPVTVLVIGSVGPLLRQVRASAIEVMDSSYFRAAQGHGLKTGTLLFRHALPSAANPLISLFGLSAGFLLSASILVEVVMSWPGMGPLMLEAIFARDLFVVIGAVMVSTVLLVLGNLFSDLLLYLCDPRIRVQS
ncbi:MAG TPA: ABC transporter permease [Terriglobales bacterium]|nr:ABC transporter permease [Terriglobales bacterium]